ncbi:hypothetical protein [Mesorhizobium atlanticum]|uniref:hypothetical protein n=1 Tax=Mesorhizobium atlanticum TaxID=2233532 RepID=UPI003CCB50A5
MTYSVVHVPVDMGGVFARVNQHIDDAGGSADGQSSFSAAISRPGQANFCFRFRSRCRKRQ